MVDFLHLQYPDLMLYLRHGKTHTTKRIFLNCAFTVNFIFF
jgi:hypothetical protein